MHRRDLTRPPPNHVSFLCVPRFGQRRAMRVWRSAEKDCSRPSVPCPRPALAFPHPAAAAPTLRDHLVCNASNVQHSLHPPPPLHPDVRGAPTPRPLLSSLLAPASFQKHGSTTTFPPRPAGLDTLSLADIPLSRQPGTKSPPVYAFLVITFLPLLTPPWPRHPSATRRSPARSP